MKAQNSSGYRIFASLHEDTDKGWVWVSPGKSFESRTTVLITREFNGQKWSVYCEYREIDVNFIMKYDRKEGTQCMYFLNHGKAKEASRSDVKLEGLEDVVVINQWYRKALGNVKTTKHDENPEQLSFKVPYPLWWGDLRAACQHPEPGVRVATRIAILGTWLGVTALLLAAVEANPISGCLMRYCLQPTLAASCLSAILGIVCFYAGRGIQRTKRTYV